MTNATNNSKKIDSAMCAMDNLERLRCIVSAIQENEKQQEILKQEKKNLLNEHKLLFKTLLEDAPKLFENALYKWAKENPIEAISYIYAYDFGTKDIYFKNDSFYEELFTTRDVSIHDKDKIFTLYDKKTLEKKYYTNGEITKHFSRLRNKEGRYLELDFLDNYKIDLIKDKGKFIDEQNWTTEIQTVNSIIPKHKIIYMLSKNFSLDHLNTKYNETKKNISFSKNGIEEFIKSHSFDLFGGYKDDIVPENVYLILNDNTPIGLIKFNVYEEEEAINLVAIELLDEYRRLGYGTQTIEVLETIFPSYQIKGYSGEDKERCAFYTSVSAEYLSCEECCGDYGGACDYNETGEYGCDEPYDYQFVIQPYR